MRLGLLTTLNTNIGDDFVREGILHVIERLNAGITPELVAVNKHQPHTVYPVWHPIRLCAAGRLQGRPGLAVVKAHAERWLPKFGFSRFDSCDVIIQCGTPVLWYGCRDSEWSRLIWRDVLARLGRRGRCVLNIGGGSCYPWERRPATLVGTPDEPFVRLMIGAARLTTVRDQLAESLFASLGQQLQLLCCPAILAARRYTAPALRSRKVLVNYMPGGGHYDFEQGIDAAGWEETIRLIINELCRLKWQPVLLAHTKDEFQVAGRNWPELPRFLARSSAEYFLFVRDAAFGVFNRLHASVALAGLGIPSVAVGTDSRNLMVDLVGLPVFYVKAATPSVLLLAISELIDHRDSESRRLLALTETTLRSYETCIGTFVGCESSALAQ